ncbi:MAG: Gfo/Idh/MocA family oxidoreductase [Verrucomicrobia bacterium]|nr:Gfo/Idh/MocA family oxidoreductase [Verrucomicrobiota bacterium]
MSRSHPRPGCSDPTCPPSVVLGAADHRGAADPGSGNLTRRRFLAATTSVAAFGVVRPALVRGTAANARVTVGIVGLGGRGAWIAEHVSRHPGFQIVAVADYFAETARGVGERLKVAPGRCYSGLSGYQGVLASKVDAVMLETPPYFFPQHVRAAVEAGCHVYMAKPVAVDVPGCRDVLEAGRRAGRGGKVFLVDFQARTDPKHIEAVRLVRAGMIGRVGLILSYYHDECFQDPPPGRTVANRLRGLAWVNDTALGGSYIVNCDIHAVDVALWVAGGLPVRAAGHSSRRRPGAQGDSHDCYAISYEFSGGLVMSNHSEHIRNRTPFESGVRAYGEQGHLVANYAGPVGIRANEDGYGGGENTELYAEGMRRNVDTFHRSIVAGEVSNPTLEPSVHATLATLLGREAGLRGRGVRWEELEKDTRRLEVDLGGLAV